MRFAFPRPEGPPTEAGEAETFEQLKNAQRPIIFNLIDNAFYHGVDIRLARRAAKFLLPGSADWLKSGQPIQHTVDTLAAADMEADRPTAHVIASSLVLFSAFQDGKKHRWMVAEILAQLSRSYMVEDRHGVLGNWRWLKKPYMQVQPDGTKTFVCGEATTPIISSLVRDRLWEPVDLGSAVEGIAMLPDDVRRFFSFTDLKEVSTASVPVPDVTNTPIDNLGTS